MPSKIEKLLSHLELNPRKTPLQSGIVMTRHEDPDADVASKIAALIYISRFRYDLQFPAQFIARFVHPIGLKQVLRYLSGTRDYSLLYPFPRSTSILLRLH
jgi:hypothetical protein